MERESFEDEEVAALVNCYFVAIKVDREERPDIDHLYMEFCQALTGSGGWPLTIMMLPDTKQPFFAGTYYPKTSRYGRPGLIEILTQVGTLWQTDEAKLRQSAAGIVSAVQANRNTPAQGEDRIRAVPVPHTTPGSDWAQPLIDKAYQVLTRTFDPHFGGFGHAPKFPTPHILGFLLRYAVNQPESAALAMAHNTLDGMAQGGIYDHLGFGFARYSTDEKWLVPHFEKMLYDNALLAYVYLESFQMSGRPGDARVAQEIFTYVLRDMASPEGAFYSAEDADSEGEEGKFYVWTPSEVHRILGTEDGPLFCSVYDITEHGNFEGKNIPNLLHTNWNEAAYRYGTSLVSLRARLEAARQSLFTVRDQRIHPHKDDKVLTAWNGLMIVAFAKGYQVFGNAKYRQAAEQAVRFILHTLRRPNGRLLARYRGGEAAYPAYLDDYAYFIWALLELYTATGEPGYLQTALELQIDQDRLFKDPAGAGYFLTGSDSEELLFRPKENYDGALPAGNSISALNLCKLSHLTGDTRWQDEAERLLTTWRTVVNNYPTGYTAYLQALQFSLYPGQDLILSGHLQSASMQAMQKTFFAGFHPYATVMYQEGTVTQIAPWLKDYPLEQEQAKAYLCQDFNCQHPVTEPDRLGAMLN